MSVVALTAAELNRITSAIIAIAIEIHRIFGSGLLESAYLRCLMFELTRAGFQCVERKPVPLVYKGVSLGRAYLADLVVNSCVIVEVKAVDAILPVHERQLQTYLRLADCRVGLLLNFGAATMTKGIKRRVYNFPDEKSA